MSRHPRFKVALSHGWPIRGAGNITGRPPGLTASVLETACAHREVRRFRSEDRLPVFPSACRGVDGALTAAQEHADKLNAECA